MKLQFNKLDFVTGGTEIKIAIWMVLEIFQPLVYFLSFFAQNSLHLSRLVIFCYYIKEHTACVKHLRAILKKIRYVNL